jgi:hypothetical protein
MGFERAKIVVKQAAIGTGVKVSLAKLRGNTAKMKFSISEQVAKSFGWAGGDKIEILIGNGEHHGIIRLRKNNSVGDAEVVHRKANKGDYFQLALGYQAMFVDRAEESRWCQFEQIDEGYVEIVLPRWADETAPAKKPAPAPIIGKPVVQPPRGGQVTANLMGDPPKGRREMLAKVGSISAD